MANRRTTARAVIAGAAALCAFTTGAASASAATIGTVASNPYPCYSPYEVSDNQSVVTTAGSIDSFSFRAIGQGGTADLQVLRPTGNANEYTVVDFVSVADNGPAGAVVTTSPAAPIAVLPGDHLGLYTKTDNFPCNETGSGTIQETSGIPEPMKGSTVTVQNGPYPGYNTNVAANVVTDAVPPACGTLTVAPGGGSASVSPSDAGSGLASITNLKVSNGTSSISGFSPGDPSATITITKTNPALKTVFRFDVTDVAGNVTHCS